MNFDRYAGMASAVGIVLILMILAWLDLWGPLNLAELQKWQTLITGFMAIFAAGIAYRGATAKVRHDREVVASENARRKLTLYLKFDLSLYYLCRRAMRLKFLLSSPPDNDREIAIEQISIDIPSELEEAWAYLDLFPRELVREISNVRHCLLGLKEIARTCECSAIVWRADEKEPPEVISEAGYLWVQLWESASFVSDKLLPSIARLAPEMDESEKMIWIYGEPKEGD